MQPIVFAIGVVGVQRRVSVFGEVYWHAFVHEKGDLSWHLVKFWLGEKDSIIDAEAKSWGLWVVVYIHGGGVNEIAR